MLSARLLQSLQGMNSFINQERKEGSVGFGVLSYLHSTCLHSNSGDPTLSKHKYNFYVKYLVNQCFLYSSLRIKI